LSEQEPRLRYGYVSRYPLSKPGAIYGITRPKAL